METKRMNIKVHLLLITFLLCSICGCKTNNSNLTKITDQRTRLEALGVSLLPPQEDGWHYAKIHPARIEFGKIGNQKGQSFAGMIVLSKLPDVGSEKEFLDVISKQRKRDSGNPRYEDLLNEEAISYEKNTIAVRFHTKYKDYGAKNLPKSSSYLIIEDIGIICRHPENKNVGVTIALSQRSTPEDASKTFKSLADEFIKNAEFKSLKEIEK